jgi:hypothetical protein
VSGDENNPLLITPPPGLLAPRSAARPPAEAAPDEPEEFITLPPGIADSATHRVASMRIVPLASPAVGEEIVFFPVVPGPPAVVPLPAPAAHEEFVDETRASIPRQVSGAAWNIVLPTGQTVPIASAVIIGRDPVANSSWPAAALLPALDPAKSLSKTHAMLEIDGDILWVHDLNSTNGVFVAAPGLGVVKVDPGTRSMVPDGAEVELGEFILTAIRTRPRLAPPQTVLA